jgi:hypothetical protein
MPLWSITGTGHRHCQFLVEQENKTLKVHVNRQFISLHLTIKVKNKECSSMSDHLGVGGVGLYGIDLCIIVTQKHKPWKSMLTCIYARSNSLLL